MSLSSKRKSIGLAVAAGTAGLVIATKVHAATGNWIGPSGGAWSAPANWQDSIIPNAQGDTATYAANTVSSIAVNDVVGGVTVGTLSVTGNGNFSMQYTPAQNIFLNQDGIYGNATMASVINDIQSTQTIGDPPVLQTGNPAIFLNVPGGTNTGAFWLQDDLFISNTSNSTRTTGSVQIRGPIKGAGNIWIENISNNIGSAQVAFTNNQSSGPGVGGFAGNVTIAKGTVTHSRGDVFTPSPGNIVTIGAAGKGDATLAFVGGSLGNIENGFVVAANTGGISRYIGNATSPTGIVQIKSTNTNAAFVNLLGDITFENRQTNGSILIVGDPVVGAGRINKTGPGPMEVTHTSTHAGGTIVETGSLKVRHAPLFNNGFGEYAATNGSLGSGDVTVKDTATQLELDITNYTVAPNIIADTAALNLAATGGMGKAVLGAGVNETVGGLVINGVAQTVEGTYGATGSGATNIDDNAFSGTGVVTLDLGRTLHWDVDGTTAGAGGATPSGTWGGIPRVFNTDSAGGAGGTLSSNSIGTDPVVFTAGSDGTGSYTVTVQGTQPAASVSVARGNVTMSGSGTINTPTVDVASGATATVTAGLTGPTNTLTKTGTGTLQVSKLPQAHVMNVNAGTVRILESSPGVSSGHPSGDNAFVSQPTSLSVASGAQLDITNNDVVIDYTGATPVAAYEALVASGYNVTGDWQGDGIVSSIAANDGNYVVAIADNATLAAPFGTAQGGPLFAGVDVDLDTVLIKFTHRADINLDGLITPDDSAIFGGNYDENQPATWATGDMNYDGIFTPDDAAIFGGAYDESLASLPEPGSLGVLALLGLGLVRRQRRQA